MNLPSFRVGSWPVEPVRNQIRAANGPTRIEPCVMRLLVLLADRSPEIVSREELTEEVWQGAFVTDEVLTQSVSELRKALGDDPREPRFVVTVPKRGYQLIAPVERSPLILDPVSSTGASGVDPSHGSPSSRVFLLSSFSPHSKTHPIRARARRVRHRDSRAFTRRDEAGIHRARLCGPAFDLDSRARVGFETARFDHFRKQNAPSRAPPPRPSS
jgi:DNA-binding winged helix-turn-helix (wHTH) protein